MEYKISYAVHTGRYHQADGIPGQDKVYLCRNEQAACAALADGAGSRRNSGAGAECVTRHVSRLLAEEFDALWDMTDAALTAHLIRECVQVLMEQAPPIYELASTLLFFAGHRDGRFLSGHLGDGVQVLVEQDRMEIFSPPENGEYQNETYFITAADADRHLRLRRGTLNSPGALLLMSDGMAESLYKKDTGTPAPACRTIAGWLHGGEEDTISEALEDNMERIFSEHSGDDLSLAVVVWK